MPICFNCKSSFPTLVEIDGRQHNLCSRKYCFNCSPFKGHNTKKLERKEEVKVKVNNMKCSNCNIPIRVEEFRKKRHSEFFCNKECQLKAFGARSSRSEKICDYCKKVFTRTSAERRKSLSGKFFCSRTCGNIYKSKNRKSSIWNPKIPLSHRKRAPVIFTAANNTCQACHYNKDSRMLDIHHHNGNNSDNSWENLRCVCVWCHVAHHRGVCLLDLPILLKTSNEDNATPISSKQNKII